MTVVVTPPDHPEMNIVMPDEQPKLGRLPNPEHQKGAWPLRAAMPQRLVRPRYRYWRRGPRITQDGTGTCVEHGVTNFYLASPLFHKLPPWPHYQLYREAVLLDVWGQNDSEATGPISGLQFGTSVDAGFSALRARGLIKEWRHAFNMDDFLDRLAFDGPIVCGMNWYPTMFDPDKNGFVKEIAGQLQGGHCICAIGANFIREDVTFVSSWEEFPVHRFTFKQVQRLIFDEAGDAAVGFEERVAA